MKSILMTTVLLMMTNPCFGYGGKFTSVILESANFQCRLRGEGITDETQVHFSVISSALKTTGEHVSTTAMFSVGVSGDRDYSPSGPRKITAMVGRISAIDQYAGTDLSISLDVEGKPVPKLIDVVRKDSQILLTMSAHFSRVSEKNATLNLIYQSTEDANKAMSFSGDCTAY